MSAVVPAYLCLMGGTPTAQIIADGSDERLRERINELGCLYAVARIAQTQELGLEPMLVAIVRTIPQGWQWPDELWVSLVLDGRSYGGEYPEGTALQQSILIDGESRGTLHVGYPPARVRGTTQPFLPEEELLLEKLAAEVATIVERQRSESDNVFSRHACCNRTG